MRHLFPHQEKALRLLLERAREGSRRPVVQLPTGAGKTRLAAEIIKRARAKGKRVMFVVPRLSLIDQTVESFATDGINDVGVIQADHPMTNPDMPVQVASVKTLDRRRDWPPVDLIIVDECHEMFRAFLKRIVSDDLKDVMVIGLSASPWARGMAKHYDDLIICATTAEMIEAGRLSKFRVFAPDHPDLSGVGTHAGDYNEKQLAKAMDKPKLVADIVTTWLRMGEGRPTLAFCVDRAHAKHVQAQFEAAQIPCGYVDAYTSADERKIVRDKVHSGEYKIVANVSCLSTGVDWDIRCIIDARPTKSEMLFVQMYGRGLRTAEGKEDCLILDHADNYKRHGFVTDIHHDKLDDGTRTAAAKRTKPLPKECPKCSHLRPAKLKECPACGYVPEGVHSGVDSEDGSLCEVTRGTGSKKTGPAHHTRIGSSWIHNSEFYAMLKTWALKRKYKPKWADSCYYSVHKKWPNQYVNVPPKELTRDMHNWCLADQIRRAKAFSKSRHQQGYGDRNARR